jgi:hypothetical protein
MGRMNILHRIREQQLPACVAAAAIIDQDRFMGCAEKIKQISDSIPDIGIFSDYQ